MTLGGELTSFIREHVRSVWALELLLVLRNDPKRAWTIAQLVGELRASTTLVADNLQRLQGVSLVIAEGADGYRFAPAGPVLEALCDRLAEAYREKPVSVINMIARPDPLQSLADAFKFRGEGN